MLEQYNINVDIEILMLHIIMLMLEYYLVDIEILKLEYCNVDAEILIFEYYNVDVETFQGLLLISEMLMLTFDQFNTGI